MTLRKVNVINVLKLSGDKGFFFNEVNAEGSLVPDYTPIWMQNQSLEQLLPLRTKDERILGIISKAVKKGDTISVSLALRVKTEHYQAVRSVIYQDEAEDTFIPSVYKYLISPLNLGMDKQDLSKVLAPLDWNFRPLI